MGVFESLVGQGGFYEQSASENIWVPREETKIDTDTGSHSINETVFTIEDQYVEAIFTSADETVVENGLEVGDTVVVELNEPIPQEVDLPVRLTMEAGDHSLLPLEIGQKAVVFALTG